MRAEQLTDVVTAHGEGPVWSSRWPGPRWVDMLVGDICELQPDGRIRRRNVGNVAAMLRPRAGGGYVVATERGLSLADADDLDAHLKDLTEIITDGDVRLNEGGCDPNGALYLGSMAYDARVGGGKLYRIVGADGENRAVEVDTVEDAVTISNGIDFSPDGNRCYYVDSATNRIDQYDWTPAGLTNRRPLADVPGVGIPDGLTVDAEGQIWVAVFGGGQVRCYSPVGTLQQVIEVPVAQVTALTFTGEALDELILTTSRHGLGDTAEAYAGALFRISPGVCGQPVRAFQG